jgi:hypothetical protein
MVGVLEGECYGAGGGHGGLVLRALGGGCRDAALDA